jgi:hypothetical protein
MNANNSKISLLRWVAALVILFSLIGVVPITAQADEAPLAVNAFIVDPFIAPDWTGENNQDASAYGASVASAGDVNGDGFADIIVGAPYYDNGQDMEGRAYVYHGSVAGLNPLPNWSFESDLAGCELGWSVASAGDINGDSYDDVLVASEFCGVVDREGRVYLFLGSAGGLSTTYAWMIQGGGADESLGWSIASAGDVNADGFDDVIVGAPWASYPEGHEGRAYVFYGSAAGLPATANWIKESNVAWSGFGVSVASAGDVNGDGYDDVVIGHDHFSNPQVDEGRAYVYLGSVTGLAADPVWVFENNFTGSGLGESVASAGDINGDGYSDVIVGGFRYSNPEVKEGVAYLFLGSGTGVSFTPAWTVESNQDYAEYGQSVASAGDVNLDGYDDVFVGAPWYSHGQPFEGRAFLYYGSSTGLLTSPVYFVESNQQSANLGYSVASAGDVNGDGVPDLIVGAQNYDNGQGNEGRAMVFHGVKDYEFGVYLPMSMR